MAYGPHGLFQINRPKPKPVTMAGLSEILKQFYLPQVQAMFRQPPVIFWEGYFADDEKERDEKIWATEWLTRVLAFHGPMTYGHLGKLVRQHKPGWTVTKLAKLARGMGWHDPKRRLYLLPDNHLAMEVRP